MSDDPYEGDAALVQVFGTWDAPITDGAEPVPVPTWQSCMNCRERFREGDNGCVYLSGYATHRECALRSALGGIGHLVDHAYFCGGELGPDAGLPKRLSSLLVWAAHVGGQEFSREFLLSLKRQRDD